MRKNIRKTATVFVCFLAVLSCLVLLFCADTGNIQVKAAAVGYAAGDINGDGKVNGKDITRLTKYIAGIEVDVVTESLDTNGDGAVDGKDITHLMRYIAGEIPELSENKYHGVIYYDELTGYISDSYYSETTGLYQLPKLSAEGRTFDGWYTEPDGKGRKIVFIPKGSTENYTLYANWKLVEYKITYINAPQNYNVDTYTIENEVALSDAQWSGLKFDCWTNAEGEEVKLIPKGSTGDITLTANWFYMENTAVPARGIRELWFDYDEKTGHQIFVYDLGEIQHVVLKSLDRKYKKFGESVSWTEETNVTFETGIAKETAKVISNSISSSQEYSRADEWVTGRSDSLEKGFSCGIEVAPIKDVLKLNAGYSSKWTESTEDSWTNVITDSTGKEISVENTESNSSTVTFNNTISETYSTSFTVGETMPEGEYRYVYYGNVRVFAVVTYEPVSGNYRMDTFSVLGDNIGGMSLYEPPKDMNVNIKSRSVLPYDIPVGENEDKTLKEIDQYMANAYYVKYDANGGTGSMYDSAYIKGQEHTLSENAFTRTGYTWDGWMIEGRDEAIKKDVVVSNLAENGELIVAKAKWKANAYTVNYDISKPVKASSDIENAPTADICYYDGNLVLPDAPSLRGWSFDGWYKNVDCTVKLGDAGEVISAPNLVESGETVLYANWLQNSYIVTLDPNGGNIENSTVTVLYDDDYSKLPEPTLANYAFIGWKLNSEMISLSDRVNTAEDHTLVAEYIKVKEEFKIREGQNKEIWDNGSLRESVESKLNKEELLANGFTALNVTVSFDEKGVQAIRYCKPILEVSTTDGKRIIKKTFGVSSDGWTKRSQSGSIALSLVPDDLKFNLYWHTEDNSIFGESWRLGETSVVIEAIK